MDNNHAMGAMPPSDSSWQIGKTAATIRFVQDAMAYIADKPRVSPI